MQGKRIIYIIGFMGSGKSTVGKKLAASLGWSFVDLDRKIEAKEGKSIPRIFEQDGEAHFRKVEADALRSLESQSDIIISTGGGTPCHGNNMEYMLETGLTVYLKMKPEQLTKRLLESSGERPLIKNVPDDQLLDFIEEKLSYREKWYQKANIVIDGINLDINRLRAMINTDSGN